MQVFINISYPAILSYMSTLHHFRHLYQTPQCAISSELLYQEVRRDNTNTSGFQTIDSHAQFNHSTQHRHQVISMLTNRRISPLLILQAGLPKFRARGLFLNTPRLSTESVSTERQNWLIVGGETWRGQRERHSLVRIATGMTGWIWMKKKKKMIVWVKKIPMLHENGKKDHNPPFRGHLYKQSSKSN